MSSENIKYILMDIEGTTTSITFVHDKLFPYAKARMESFVLENEHNQEVELILARVPGQQCSEKIKTLKNWIDQDQKIGELKLLQGLIWKEGYEKGEIKGHIYDDVLPAFKRWKKSGLSLGIYSSGSVLAQKLLFAHSLAGDLDQYISNNFDTNVGHKREMSSYQKISEALKLPPAQILFLSDIKEELEAAMNCGFHTIQLVRNAEVDLWSSQREQSFDTIL